ncbi:hypothetical protein AAZX31_12G140500 [Glycine max]
MEQENRNIKGTAVTTAVLKVTALCPCKGCNNRIHRAVLKNKNVFFFYLFIDLTLFFVCALLLTCVEMVWRRS